MADISKTVYTRLFVNDFQDLTITTVVFFVPGVPPFDKLIMMETITAALVADPLHQKMQDDLILSDMRDLSKGNATSIGLSIKDTVEFRIDRVRDITDTLDLTERITYTLNGSAPTPEFTAIPTLTLSGGGGTTLHLRAPVFGDMEKLQFTRIGRNTIGGDLIVFQDPMWPTTDVFHFEFEYLTKAQATALLTFFQVTIGKTITIIDHYSRSWDGYLLTPDSSIVQPKVHGFSASFDFQNKIDT